MKLFSFNNTFLNSKANSLLLITAQYFRIWLFHTLVRYSYVEGHIDCFSIFPNRVNTEKEKIYNIYILLNNVSVITLQSAVTSSLPHCPDSTCVTHTFTSTEYY